MSRRKPSVVLPSSQDLLIFPDESIDEGVLGSLLREASSQGVHLFKKVKVGIKSRDWRFNSWGEDWTYKETSEPVRLYELVQMWQNLSGVSPGQSYSSEAESARLSSYSYRGFGIGTAVSLVMHQQNEAIKKGIKGPFF